jgi:hypothetical protein
MLIRASAPMQEIPRPDARSNPVIGFLSIAPGQIRDRVERPSA